MKIAILGTRGIPNQYGGFEQFAEYLSLGLTERGHEVTVYVPHYHSFKSEKLNKVVLKRVYCPEKLLGGAAHYLYDHLCLKNAISADYDLIYEAGYASAAFAIWYFKRASKRPIIITNMDGMEWKRSKWSKPIQYLTRQAESIAVRKSDYLIADNVGIQKYFEKKYRVKPFFLPYGATPVESFDPQILNTYSLKPSQYYLLIARLEPENNVEMIIRGIISSGNTDPLIIVGGLSTKHARKLIHYSNDYPFIKFLGGIYDLKVLNNLRHFAKAYLHGHTVGGTNPSLLEAMACSSFIIAHDNEFNRSVLKKNALFFDTESALSRMLKPLNNESAKNDREFRQANMAEIKLNYDWDQIIEQHEKLFLSLLIDKSQGVCQ